MWTVCTKEIEEDGVCCCSERLSAENGSTCMCGCCYDARTLYAVSSIVNAATVGLVRDHILDTIYNI